MSRSDVPKRVRKSPRLLEAAVHKKAKIRKSPRVALLVEARRKLEKLESEEAQDLLEESTPSEPTRCQHSRPVVQTPPRPFRERRTEEWLASFQLSDECIQFLQCAVQSRSNPPHFTRSGAPTRDIGWEACSGRGALTGSDVFKTNRGFVRSTLHSSEVRTRIFSTEFSKGLYRCLVDAWGAQFAQNCVIFREHTKLFLYKPSQGTGEYHYDYTGGQIANILCYLSVPERGGATACGGGAIALKPVVGRVYIW
eukprot:645756_1